MLGGYMAKPHNTLIKRLWDNIVRRYKRWQADRDFQKRYKERKSIK